MNKKSDIAIKYNNSRIFFSTIVIVAATAISILLVLLIPSSSSSSSFFVFAVDMPPQSPSPQPPATTTTEKPTTDSIPNLPKIEEKKEPKDGDTILSSKPDNGVTVATKVDKNSNTIKMDFNRGYVLGFAAALDPGLSKVFKGKMQGIAVLLDDYPKEFQNGFLLGYVSASDYLNTFGLLGSNPLKNK